MIDIKFEIKIPSQTSTGGSMTISNGANNHVEFSTDFGDRKDGRFKSEDLIKALKIIKEVHGNS